MDLIVKMLFGSHLYGTQTPDSDTDYKGVFMPTKEQVYLGKIPKHMPVKQKDDPGRKNTKDDVDIEIFSLHHFINLALQGQTIALDMLHAPASYLEVTSSVWNRIVANREKFYTKNMNAFMGYARKQAAKYGIKGSRLAAIQEVLHFLAQYDATWRLADVWADLPRGEYMYEVHQHPSYIHYSVAGQQFPPGAKIGYVIPILQQKYDQYGARAKLAKENKGVDWKAMSHALRAAFQLRSLYTEGTIVFPLPEANFLKEVKRGYWGFGDVASYLEDEIYEVQELARKSNLPDQPDTEFWNQFIVEVLDENL